MTRRLSVVLGVVLFVDVLRVWLPSIITVFGQAASTPAELLGAFALMWFVLALAAPLVARWSLVPVVAGMVLAACRFALVLSGGQVLLYVACAGLLAGLCWLVALAMRGVSPRWVAVGLAAAAVEHAAVGTVDLTWRGVAGGVLVAATAAGFVALLLKHRDAASAPASGWFVVGPVAFVALQVALSPSVVTTGVSYVDGDRTTDRWRCPADRWRRLPVGR